MLRPTDCKVASPRSGTCGLVQVRILEDKHRRFSTQFEEDRLPVAARYLRDLMSGGRTSSKVDLSDSWMGDQCLSDTRSVLWAVYDGIEASGGQSRLSEYIPLQRGGFRTLRNKRARKWLKTDR